MANTLTTWIFVILLGLSVDGARKVPYLITGHDGTSLSSLAGDDGICKAMVETQGYVCEEHTVTTKDGYILSMQRMPMGRSGKKSDKPPVLLQHGILTDASSWLLNSPDESLAFILADNGYDVWLVSTRGTKYSSGHTSLSPSEPAYWNWSWDELAAYDLPASFEYVHDETGQKLHYVGHSLGTLMALAAFSQDNLLNMLRSAALFCPIAYLNQIPTLLAKVAADSFIAEDLYWLGLYEFCSRRGSCCQTSGRYLPENPHFPNLLKIGKNCCVNSSKINILLDHEPQPTATKNMIHLSQMIRKGTIAMYDYGSEAANNKQYGQPTPPVYNMASIPNDVPLFLGYGGQDMISDVKDVHTLLDSLKDHDADKLVLLYREEYAHVDFVFGINANQVVYDPLMSFFKLN
ncbi:Myzus persicae-induced lipase 1 [Actinidia rufa]|uniref:Lipase n=1 Tax=Actinidia rufa TaxID=165716 RepID=A0A7J0DPY6_9ERIC|nr:Myzus persicae-induced lipase 1 [Actinidia rufa]